MPTIIGEHRIGQRAMSEVEFENGAFSVDAALIASGLGIDAVQVQPFMRDGTITSICERGVDEDAGRYRLTFFHETRSFRLLVDDSGHVIQKSRIKLATSPGASRKGGPDH